MRTPIAVSVAITVGVALSLGAALPASAVVVTTADVPVAEFLDLTDENFTHGEFFPLLPAGPAVLPVAFSAEGGFTASGLTPGSPAVGCTRVVNSVSLEFTTQPADDGAFYQLVFATGEPADYFPDPALEYEGDGFAEVDESGVVDVSILGAELESTSRLTITPATPATDGPVLALLGAFSGTSGSLTAASFNVTDTCPSAAVVPTPAALPNMGATDVAPLALVALGALLAGCLALVVTRRRAQRS